MLFTVVQRNEVPESATSCAFVVDDNWDDWGKFRTQFQIVVFAHDGTKFSAGSVKIGEIGLLPSAMARPGARAPSLPMQFDSLPEVFFSLGQDENYYETINRLPADLRSAVLTGLRDCAADLAMFDRLQVEEVMGESLLRYISAENVRNRFHRLAWISTPGNSPKNLTYRPAIWNARSGLHAEG